MLALRWNFDAGEADLVQDDLGSLVDDQGLESLIAMSLFTDAPATEAEVAAAGLEGRRGWWADALRDTGQPAFGSRLWLLTREKTTLATLRRAQAFAKEALDWLVSAGIAGAVTVEAIKLAPGLLGLDIAITRPAKLLPPFRRLWEVTTGAL